MANGDKYIINETTEKATLRYPAFSEANKFPFHHPFTLEGKHILSQRLHPVVSKMHLSKLLSYLPQSKQSVLKLSGAKSDIVNLPRYNSSNKQFCCKELRLVLSRRRKGGRGLASHLIVQVPQEALKAYQEDSHWVCYVNYIYPIDNKATIQQINGCRF